MTAQTVGSIMILIPVLFAVFSMLAMFLFVMKEGPWQARIIGLMLASFLIGTFLMGVNK